MRLGGAPRGGEHGAGQCGAAGVRAGARPRGRRSPTRCAAGPTSATGSPATGWCRSWCCCPATPSRWPRPCGCAPSTGSRSSPAGPAPGCPAGALPVADGVVISLARLNRVLEVDPVDRRAVRGAGRHQPGDHRGGRPARAVLRARPVQPAGVHDRRQRRGELRRRALPQVRVHHQPRAVAGGGAGRRLGRSRSAATPASRPARTCAGCSSAREGTLGITTKITVRLLRTPESVRTLLADFPSVAAAGDVVSATSSPPGSCPPPWR